MGFNTDIKRKLFDKETMNHLATNEKLLSDISSILLALNKMDSSNKKKKIRTTIKNIQGERAIVSVIGINSTSIVSSEIEGSVTFTFIKDLMEARIISTPTKSTPKLVLVRN